MSLIQGRKSPVNLVDQGRRSPLLLLHDRMRSPNEPPINGAFIDFRSPTKSPTDRRSPTLSVHDRRSPVNILNDQYQRRSPTSTVHVQDGRSYDLDENMQEDEQRGGILQTTAICKRTSISLFTPIPMSGEKRSPILPMPIPPITVSNPIETCKIVERMAASSKQPSPAMEISKSIDPLKSEKQTPESLSSDKESGQPEKKERTSVMKEILAFVRKPSKRITTRTGSRFAAAFTRAESGSSSGPLIRQSTFSASPAAASNAAKSAVTKQMSEVGFEPKMSLKFGINTKMSLKLRRSAASDEKKKDKKSSGDEASGTESDSKSEKVGQKKSTKLDRCSIKKSKEHIPFELANVHFEKVGDSYIKHDQPQKDEDYINGNGSLKQKIVALSNENAQKNLIGSEHSNSDLISSSSSCGNRVVKASSREFQQRISEEQESDPIESIEQFKSELEQYLQPIKPEPIYVNLMELRNELGMSTSTESIKPTPLQCPIIEFEPPSRRSSFDPPRSPYLENLRSPGVDTDRSGGDSFEMVDSGDRNRESSFEDRYSSRDTSFDISRYQSTSYEDQTSSFEIVDIDTTRADDKKSNIDLRKSSIELVDAETFARSSSASGRKSSLETHFDYIPTDNQSGKPSPSIFPSGKKQKPDHFRSRDIHISPFSAFSRARSPLSNQTSSNYSSRDSYDSSCSYPHSSSHCESQKSPFADHTKQHFPLTIKNANDDVVKTTFLCTDKRCSSIFEPRTTVQTTILTTVGTTTIAPVATSTISSSTTLLSGVGLNIVPVTSPGLITIPNNNTLIGRSGSRPGCMSTLEFAEFEPPSPRRAASASPKHTFTFRIVLKKVDSSPDAICPSAERRGRNLDRHKKHRDSRRQRLSNAGKSF
ncbi:serine-enriched protein-like [Condylostylus longicornis]|uniref:serine-enriched protein-like n=1 Tax=Condylostylus longicornis TaxID=2530218 RepID=UPI00244E40CA|nr:serine-enriched protein-like [Condylostylus longicornis]